MPDARAAAAAYGVCVEFADLGDWGPVTLVAEYDPEGPVIRVNSRHVQTDVERAIWHELYHHREAMREVPCVGDRSARERAADAFAEQCACAR